MTGARGTAARWNGGICIGAVALVLALVCAGPASAQEEPPAKTAHDIDLKGTVGGLLKGETEEGTEGDTDGGRTGLPGVGAVVKMLLWLGVVVVLIYGGVLVIRRYVPSARNMFGGGTLKVVARTYISSKQSILLVRVGSKFVMVGVTGGSMSPLAEISDPAEAEKLAEELAAQDKHARQRPFRKAMDHAAADYRGEGAASGTGGDSDVDGVRAELDAVKEKMNWWRRQRKS